MGNVAAQRKSGRKHTQQVYAEIEARFGANWHWAWVYGATGHHKDGRAIDIMTLTANQGSLQVAWGHSVANYLWANRKRLGVYYVIYRQKIISVSAGKGYWRQMENRGNPTANHMDHVHVSFLNSPPAYRGPSGGSTPAPAPGPSLPKTAKYVPYPGAAWFNSMPKSAIITAMGRRLVAEGCGKYSVGPGPNAGSADVASYEAWQKKAKFAVGWPPGKGSWDALKVPNPNYVAPSAPEPPEDPLAGRVRHWSYSNESTPVPESPTTGFVKIWDDGLSILGPNHGPADWWGTASLTVSGLPVGSTLHARFVEVSSVTDVVTRTYPIVEVVGTAGQTFVNLNENGGRLDPGRKLRVLVTCWSGGVTVDQASFRGNYIKD